MKFKVSTIGLKTVLWTILIGFLGTGCNHDRNDPGRAYFGNLDMYYSEAYDAYSPNPVLTDSMTLQHPPEGTIARGQDLYQFKAGSMDDQIRAGKELINPVKPTPTAVAKGKEQYQIFCMDCHGEKGDGKGYLYTSGLFPAQPRPLNGDYVQSKPDGEIFHVITMGSVSRLMGPHGAQIRPENRWKIVLYIRTLAEKN